MHLAHPLPWWLALLLAGAVAAAVIVEYRRPLSPLTRVQRGVLAGMRALLLAMLVLFLFRPIVLLPPQGLRDAIVPILIDASRSMRLNDAGNQTRLNRALAILKTELLPALGSQYRTEIFS